MSVMMAQTMRGMGRGMIPRFDETKRAIVTVTNSAGGQSFPVDDRCRLLRFLILGSEEGTYYASPQACTIDNLHAVQRMLASKRGPEVVALLVEVCQRGRAPRRDPALAVLALCAINGDAATKAAAREALPDVATIPTHLFTYLTFCHETTKGKGKGKGWGRGQRSAVAAWYNNFRGSIDALAYALTKYRHRNGWTHKDALTLSHAKPQNDAYATLFAYVVYGPDSARFLQRRAAAPDVCAPLLTYLDAVEAMRRLPSDPDQAAVDRAVGLIETHNLVREHIPSVYLKQPAIWSSLLTDMPMMAMVRNLGRLGSLGLLDTGGPHTELVAARLRDAARVKGARIHPIHALVALQTYRAGRGEKGKLTWTPTSAIESALEECFLLSFDAVTPTNKRYLLALDVSGSMGYNMCDGNLTCMQGAMAMAMATLRTEPYCTTMCFSHTFRHFDMDRATSLAAAMARAGSVGFGMTDCALPMVYASEHNLDVDVFVVYTDNETYFGNVHPCDALARYRQISGNTEAKLIVVGMASNGFSIANPADRGMLDVVGFDSASLEAMAAFANGEI